jgi:alpha-1,2-mannosyltransferase
MTRDATAPERRSLPDGFLGATALLGALLAVCTIYLNAKSHSYGFDFRGGAWAGGRDVLHGRSPYPAPDPGHLVAVGNAYVPPPLLAVLSVPLAVLPWVPAAVVMNVVCAAALVLALRVVGVRDWRVYVLALASYPFVSSIVLGQPDALLMLGVALAWRYRSSWRGAAAAGAVIALKLFAWPLVGWFLVTRRFRQAGVASAVAIALTAASWALIGFEGLAQYPRLLSADATAFQARSRSVVAAALGLGTTVHAARLLALIAAAAVAAAVWRLAGDRDLGAFGAAIAFGLLSSPILWMHYLLILLVPLAIAHRRASAVWLVPLAYWVSPTDLPAPVWKITCVLAVTATLSVLAAKRLRPRAQAAETLPQAVPA